MLKGFKDILFKEKEIKNNFFYYLKNIFIKIFFFEIETPIIELYNYFKYKSLFFNEIYNFYDYNNKEICLRPENTLFCFRIFKKIKKSIKIFYFGPMFRYENSQLNKLKQFNQFGVEIYNNKIIEEINLILILFYIFKKNKNIKLFLNNFFNINFKILYLKIIIFYIKKKFFIKIKKKFLIFKILDKNNIKKFIFLNKLINKKNSFLLKIFLFFIRKKKFYYYPKLLRGIEYYSNIIYEFKYKKKYSICGGGGYNYFGNNLNFLINSSFGFSIGIERFLYKKKIFKKTLKIKILNLNIINIFLNYFFIKFVNNNENIEIKKLNYKYVILKYKKKSFYLNFLNSINFINYLIFLLK